MQMAKLLWACGEASENVAEKAAQLRPVVGGGNM